ncbi:hypothetical protein SMACR_05105 [Sordaria macrospora]|uniref:1,3-beta-glucanosyltransferase n=2 Tax=Sordaria macrospora TaxID=5147 RepID=F7W2P2_SORMK|nr:uncharacterized protein SMAC_05105 [Sordaria macrospora k-hell]KAA8632024.1 hypothetical protein SMACR_05105 [Sordaria macrospora]KAH7632516.1 Glucanosyltransferase-domain-containing protein [Sordaria sp. MPI-SDFR-AT-0083]WPJ60997.1 hypothetical protein SMAC4_05105 [Sordaria macrospora]CCC11893.1 unnamed protein product [Sordaria macrospora k-hell]
MVTSKAALIAGLTLASQASAALQPIVMKGTKFFYENGTQFYIKGIAYQQDTTGAGGETTTGKFRDPLADEEACKRDVPIMKAAGTNAIRTYAIDPEADHTACMKLLDDAGIYVISDLSEPSKSINRDDPRWDVTLFKRYTDVIDEMTKYTNVIGFFAGNEVSNNASNTDASAYVKAAVRDTKNYIKENVKRWVGVGYAANDDPKIRAEIAHYFNCGNQDEAIDYWGYNIYEWCGENTIKGSGYQEQIDFFKNYSVPVFFAEYGCNNPGGAEARIFQETTALYSDAMTDVFSGGIVYMYFQEENDYGLVNVSGKTAKTLKNYDKLKTAVLGAKPKTVDIDEYQPSNKAAECPDVTSNWKVTGDALPPTPDENLCECMYNSLTCVPTKGLDTEDYGELFGTVCGNDAAACAGILGDPATGVYGAYAMCNSLQQLGYVMDQYYKNQKYASHACDFDGKASTNGGAKADPTCSAALKSAEAANAVAATATAGSGNGGTDGGAASSETSESFASPVAMKSFFTVADMAVGLYVVVAMGVGAGMVML